MDQNSKPFSNLFVYCDCSKCNKRVMLNLANKQLIRYGFVCGNCKRISTPDEMWESLLKSRKTLFSK